MTNCYFLSCHRSRSHVSDLIRYLYRPEHLYIIHADPKAPPELLGLVSGLGERLDNVLVLPSREYSWAGYSMVETTLSALRLALSVGSDWAHFFWLSEQHLPLRGQDAACWTLDPALSYCDALPVSEMDPAGQADVMHRFSLRFRELEGVGAFGIEPANIDPALVARLHHGSNWIALNRAAAVAIAERAEAAEVSFRDTVHADELMLQTLLADSGLPVERWNPTFIAWPHLSGSPDMICNEGNVATARQERRLFIRKRPDRLWPALALDLDRAAGLSLDWLAGIPDAPASAAVACGPLVRSLLEVAAAEGMASQIRSYHDEGVEYAPSVYVALRSPAATRNLRLCVLSENLRTFKVLIAVDSQSSNWLESEEVGGHRAHPIRARIHDLFMNREIVIADESNHGFVTLPEGEAIEPLLSTVRRYLRHLAAIGPLQGIMDAGNA
jgi:hypothetical protein